ncbi:hypothetical protein [Sinorhizobium terangae]|uniref:hypothetical protein n=1 Tax=Sinorhizobium terangae TaxID=110322 RepID=UPI0031FD86AA
MCIEPTLRHGFAAGLGLLHAGLGPLRNWRATTGKENISCGVNVSMGRAGTEMCTRVRELVDDVKERAYRARRSSRTTTSVSPPST